MSLTQKILIGFFIALVAFYSVFELYDELKDFINKDETILHVSFEIFIVIISFSALLYFVWLIIRQSKNQLKLEENLLKIKKQLDGSNIRLQEGKKEYQKVIQWQFDEWALSPSEKEVALLMLKGLSIKDISQGRSTHEKTVRKQASAIYDKSKLAGRHELSAWFFEDLL